MKLKIEMTLQMTYDAIYSHQFQIVYYIKVCNKCSFSLILTKRNDLIFLITGTLFLSLPTLLWTHAQRASMLYFADVFYVFL